MVPNPDLPSPVPAGAGAGGPLGAPDPRGAPHPEDEGRPPDGGGLLTPRRRYGFDKEVVRKVIEKRFRVYEERDALPGLDQAVLVAFFVQAEREQLDAEFPGLQADLRDVDPLIQATLREEGGETIIVVTRRSEDTRKVDPRLAVGLMLATVIMLSLSGSIAWAAYESALLADANDLFSAMIEPRYLGLGFVAFAVPFIFVFGVQEVARRVTARRHGVTLGPSYWIPVPPVVFVLSIGTFGSVVHGRGALPDRRALFDVSAAGPIAGFLAALPIVALGILLTVSAGVVVPDRGAAQLEIVAPDGTMWTEGDGGLFDPFERSEEDPETSFRAHNVTITATLQVAGRGYGDSGWVARGVGAPQAGRAVPVHLSASALTDDDATVLLNETAAEVTPESNATMTFSLTTNATTLVVTLEFRVDAQATAELGLPLAYRAMQFWLADDDDALMHPVAFAGWAILLVIGITLLPTGRLDGGGVARAALGERMVVASWAALFGVAVLWFFYPGWLYLVLTVLLFMGTRYPAALNETTALDNRRWLVLGLLVLLFVITFVPIPTVLPGRGF